MTGARQCRLTTRQIRAALQAYRIGKPAYAPAGLLYFEARPDADRLSVAGMKLHLRTGDESRSIAPDAENRFVLPQMAGSGWDLVGNCYRGGIAITPLVMSPDTTQADRRLGDLRLQCEVSWAIVQESVAASPGAFVEAASGCKGSRSALHAVANRRIASAVVTTGTRIEPVAVSDNGFSYRLRLHDRTLPNTARVRFSFD